MTDSTMFLKACPEQVPAPSPLPAGYEYVFWRPSLTTLVPPGLDILPFLIWWAFHTTHIFSNRDYGVFLILRNRHVVHRSTLTPRYFRFPFMRRDDLQVGDTWTHEDERGKGLAAFALQSIVAASSDR